MTRKEIVRELYKERFNCSQRTLSAFCDECNLENEVILKITSGFGAGMQHGEVCGAISSAVMVLGLKYGHSAGTDNTSKQKTYNLVQRFHGAFQSVHGSIRCKELIGLDLARKEDMEIAKENNVFQTTCAQYIDDVVDILEEIIASNDIE